MVLIVTRINNFGGRRYKKGCSKRVDNKRKLEEQGRDTEFEVIYRNCVSLCRTRQRVSEVSRGGSYVWNLKRSRACGDGVGCDCSLIIIKRQTSLALGI